jgi:hypothetical protein
MWKTQQQQKAPATPCKGTRICTPKQAGEFVNTLPYNGMFQVMDRKKCFTLDTIVIKYKNLPSSTPP